MLGGLHVTCPLPCTAPTRPPPGPFKLDLAFLDATQKAPPPPPVIPPPPLAGELRALCVCAACCAPTPAPGRAPPRPRPPPPPLVHHQPPLCVRAPCRRQLPRQDRHCERPEQPARAAQLAQALLEPNDGCRRADLGQRMHLWALCSDHAPRPGREPGGWVGRCVCVGVGGGGRGGAREGALARWGQGSCLARSAAVAQGPTLPPPRPPDVPPPPQYYAATGTTCTAAAAYWYSTEQPVRRVCLAGTLLRFCLEGAARARWRAPPLTPRSRLPPPPPPPAAALLQRYNYTSPGSSTGIVSNFTQMIWQGSNQLGCGIARRAR